VTLLLRYSHDYQQRVFVSSIQLHSPNFEKKSLLNKLPDGLFFSGHWEIGGGGDLASEGC
jgi:hypothetical protein